MGVNAVEAAGAIGTPEHILAPSPAQQIIARATDPATGVVDTRQLAAWVAEAAGTSPEKASAAFTSIEAQLDG